MTLMTQKDTECLVKDAIEKAIAKDRYAKSVTPFNPATDMIELVMSDGSKVSLDMRGVLAKALAQAKQADVHVVAWKDYNAANNTGKLQLSDGTLVAVDLTAVIADAVSSIVLPNSMPPSGNAGGDLEGTYPNPTVREGTSSKPGKVRFATIEEAKTGTSTETAVTPAGVKEAIVKFSPDFTMAVRSNGVDKTVPTKAINFTGNSIAVDAQAGGVANVYNKDATSSTKGVVRTATENEAIKGLDVDAYVTPAQLKGFLDYHVKDATTTNAGLTRYATVEEAKRGTSGNTAVTPAGLAAAIAAATYDGRTIRAAQADGRDILITSEATVDAYGIKQVSICKMTMPVAGIIVIDTGAEHQKMTPGPVKVHHDVYLHPVGHTEKNGNSVELVSTLIALDDYDGGDYGRVGSGGAGNRVEAGQVIELLVQLNSPAPAAQLRVRYADVVVRYIKEF